jgi:ribosomal protein L24E
MKCTYCQTEIKKGTGTMYVHKIGTLNYFCSNRCYRSSIILKRKINKKETRQRK